MAQLLLQLSLLRVEQHGLLLQVVASVLQLLLLSARLVLSLHQTISHLRVQSISVVRRLRHFLMKIVNRVDQPVNETSLVIFLVLHFCLLLKVFLNNILQLLNVCFHLLALLTRFGGSSDHASRLAAFTSRSPQMEIRRNSTFSSDSISSFFTGPAVITRAG